MTYPIVACASIGTDRAETPFLFLSVYGPLSSNGRFLWLHNPCFERICHNMKRPFGGPRRKSETSYIKIDSKGTGVQMWFHSGCSWLGSVAGGLLWAQLLNARNFLISFASLRFSRRSREHYTGLDTDHQHQHVCFHVLWSTDISSFIKELKVSL
jgi:hypothetical protein